MFAIRHFQARNAEKAEQRTRVLRLDPRKVEPATRALLLLETIPELRDAERDEAVAQLRGALAAVPRAVLVHHPSFEIETLRFSDDGRAMLWHDKPAADGRITIEKSFQRPPVVSKTSGLSYATFVDPAGTEFVTRSDREKGVAARELRSMMSTDGGYLVHARDDLLLFWRVERASEPAVLVTDVPYGTTRLHCVRSTSLCGVESPGRFTFVDVKKRRVLRSIPVERSATLWMSASGRLAGVAAPRAGITIHAAGHDRKVRVATSTVEDFAFSGDEKSVVTLDRDGVLHSFDAATGKSTAQSALLRQEQWKRPARIEAVGDGRFVVWDANRVRLVSADLSAVTARFDEAGDVVLVETNARGDRLAIARRPGLLTLWDISPKPALPFIDDELIESACGHVGRALTPKEWATYLPHRRYDPKCVPAD